MEESASTEKEFNVSRMKIITLDQETCDMSDAKVESICNRLDAQKRLINASASGVIYGALLLASFFVYGKSTFLLDDIEENIEQVSAITSPDHRFEACKSALTPIFEKKCAGVDDDCEYCDPELSEQHCLSKQFETIVSPKQCEATLQSKAFSFDFINKIAFLLAIASGSLAGLTTANIIRHRGEVRRCDNEIKEIDEFFDNRMNNNGFSGKTSYPSLSQ